MRSNNVRLEGLKGRWYMIDEYHSIDGSFYLWESEQHGEDWPAALTDQNLNVLDTDCYGGIYVALRDNGVLV